ncbi:hypothetical protein DINM_006364 [Dirofilaria immitis]|nr:hypothetical protein [Dirofilaria immitis]
MDLPRAGETGKRKKGKSERNDWLSPMPLQNDWEYRTLGNRGTTHPFVDINRCYLFDLSTPCSPLLWTPAAIFDLLTPFLLRDGREMIRGQIAPYRRRSDVSQVSLPFDIKWRPLPQQFKTWLRFFQTDQCWGYKRNGISCKRVDSEEKHRL